MINPIEQLYSFPDWLGNMYNVCDWIEPETKPVECSHLEAEVESTLKLYTYTPRKVKKNNPIDKQAFFQLDAFSTFLE